MDSKKLAQLCRDLAENRKAEDLVILDVRKLSTVTDYYVIATGTSTPHLRAIGDEITEKLRAEFDLRPRAMDGESQSPWQILDYTDVMVHIMNKEARDRYNLEELWKDAPKVTRRAAPAKKKAAKKTE